MANDLKQYQAAEGLSDEEMAERLSRSLDRTISVQGYKIVKGRGSAPAEWLAALSIAPQDSGSVDPTPRSADDDAPPVHREVLGSLPFEPNSVKAQIELVYTLAGKGAAMGMKSPPVALVWQRAAPDIAEAYIAWARENATVAHYLGMLTLGGAGGQLILMHGSLLVSTLLASGQIQAPQFVPPTMRTPQETDTISQDDDDEDETHTPTPPRDPFVAE